MRTHLSVYEFEKIDTPKTIDIEHTVCLLVMAPRLFAAVNESGVSVYCHEGKTLSSPRLQCLSPRKILKDTISLSNDTLAAIDHTDMRIIRLFDYSKGSSCGDSITNIKNDIEVRVIKLSQCACSQENRRLVFMYRKQ